MEFKVRDFTDGDRALAAQWVSLLPTHLFKYRTLTGEGKDRLAGLVRDSTLYFPTFAELNDPFDSNFSYDFSAPVEVREAHWRHALPPHLPDREAAIRAAVEFALDEEKANASVRELLSKVGVYCLTAKPDNILMWSYYADGHSGALPCRQQALDAIILGFRISVDDERFVRELAASFSVPVLRASKMEREYGIQIEGHG